MFLRRRLAAALPAAFLALLCLLLSRGSARSQEHDTARELTDDLIAHGFENVVVRASGGSGAPERVVVRYENRVHRYEMVALGVVAALCAPRAGTASTLEIVTCTRGVPVLSISAGAGDWVAFLAGEVSPEEFRARIEVHTGNEIDHPAGRAPAAGDPSPRRANPSTWKLDLAARPLMEIQLGVGEDPFRWSAWIAPEATLSPLLGTLLTAQVRITIEDEIDPDRRAVAPGRTTLSAAHGLPFGCLGIASAGYFPGERYGAGIEVGRFLGDGDVELRLGGDLSGSLVFLPETILYSGIETWSGAATVVHRTRGFDLETSLSGGRFQDEDWGGRLDVVRRFRETAVGFFAIRTDAGSVGGFRLDIPLPVARQSRPSRVRLATVPSFPWEYRESLEPVGRRLRVFDTLDRLRRNLSPTVVANNVEQMRGALRFVSIEAAR